jgi:hypothetical protein
MEESWEARFSVWSVLRPYIESQRAKYIKTVWRKVRIPPV